MYFDNQRKLLALDQHLLKLEIMEIRLKLENQQLLHKKTERDLLETRQHESLEIEERDVVIKLITREDLTQPKPKDLHEYLEFVQLPHAELVAISKQSKKALRNTKKPGLKSNRKLNELIKDINLIRSNEFYAV